MRILIADDHSGIRNLLQRVLEYDYPVVEIHGASNGLEAFDAMLTRTYDLVLLDIDMPVVNGLDTLKAIRRSSSHRNTPVVIMTGATEERQVQEIINAGVSDYLTKPLKADIVRARLGRVIRGLSRSVGDQEAPDAILPGSRVLLVDASPGFRDVFVRCMGATWSVKAIDSGVAALHHCLETDRPPTAVFVGPTVGLVDPELLVKALRECRTLIGMRIVGVVPHGSMEAARASGLFDAVIPRAFAEDALQDAMRQLSRVQMPDTRLVLEGSPLAMEVPAAIEQVLRIVFGLELRTAEAEAEPEPRPTDWLMARVEMHNEDVALDLSALCPAGSARGIAARKAGGQPGALTEEQAVATMAKLVQFVASRIEHGPGRTGLVLSSGPPRTAIFRNQTEPECAATDSLEWRFESTDGLIDLIIRVATLSGAGERCNAVPAGADALRIDR